MCVCVHIYIYESYIYICAYIYICVFVFTKKTSIFTRGLFFMKFLEKLKDSH